MLALGYFAQYKKCKELGETAEKETEAQGKQKDYFRLT